MEDNKKLLLNGTTRLPEIDDSDDNEIDHEKTAEEQYVFSDLIDNINTLNFKDLYLSSKQFILNTSNENQRILCIRIVNKIKQEYDLQFLNKIKIEDKNDFYNVYKLIEFLEYDHISFISDIWRFLNVDILKTEIRDYCKNNSKKLIKEFDDQIETHVLPKMVSDLFRTNTKSTIINLISIMTEKSKIEIMINVEGGM